MNLKSLAEIKNIFFSNITTKQTIFKNIVWSAIQVAATRFLGLVLLVYVARILGATEYGKLSFAMAFVSIFIIFHEFGLSNIITREFSQDDKKKEEFHSIISLKIILGLITFILILLGSIFITQDPEIKKTILILALFSITNSFISIFYSIFQARQHMEYESWAEILQIVLGTVLGFLIIFKFPSVINLSYTYLFAAFVTLIFVLIFFHFKIFPLKISWEKSIWKKFFMMAWPLALAASFSTLYNYTDSVMMGHWGMIAETGWYDAAYKISWTAFIFIGLITSSFYPVLSESFRTSKERLQKVWNYEIEIIITLVPLLITGGVILAPKIIDFVYGASFSPSILVFQILIISTGISLIYTTLKDMLIVSHLQQKFFLAIMTGAIINIITNWIFIPRYGPYGAAATTLATNFIILIMLYKFILKFTSVRPSFRKIIPTLLFALFASFITYLVISKTVICHLNLFLAVLIAIAVYFAVFLFLKTAIQYFKNRNYFYAK